MERLWSLIPCDDDNPRGRDLLAVIDPLFTFVIPLHSLLCPWPTAIGF